MRVLMMVIMKCSKKLKNHIIENGPAAGSSKRFDDDIHSFVFHDKAKRTQQGDLLIITVMMMMVFF